MRVNARLEIAWPSGAVQRLSDVPADRLVTIREPSGKGK
jgi:hypothetical protein